MRTHVEGAALFGAIPLVLWLYLAQPLGPGRSVLLGMVLMFGHRFVAAPWMARHAEARCLWCGSVGAPGIRFEVLARGRPTTVAACDPSHRDAAARFLTFVSRFRIPIAAGIFLPLILLLGGSLAAAAGIPVVSHDASRTIFRVVVAVTVAGASIGWFALRKADAPPACPFPLHNLFLLGIRTTLWIFRVVGAAWLVIEIPPLVRALVPA